MLRNALLYGPQRRYLGETGDGANAAASILNTAAKNIGPASSGVTQTRTSKAAQDIKNYALKAAVLAQSIPPPAGQVVGAVLVVVAGAAALVDAIWGTDKDKAKLAEAGQLNQLNSVLRSQLLAVNQKTQSVTNGLQDLQKSLQAQGLAGFSCNLSGLGSPADDILFAAKATNVELQKALDNRIQVLQTLINNFNSIVDQVYNAITGKSRGEKIILYSILGLAAFGLGLYAVRKLQHKEK